MDGPFQSFLDKGWKIEITPVRPEDYGIDPDKIQVEKLKGNPRNPKGDDGGSDVSEFMIEVVRIFAVHYYFVIILL